MTENSEIRCIMIGIYVSRNIDHECLEYYRVTKMIFFDKPKKMETYNNLVGKTYWRMKGLCGADGLHGRSRRMLAVAVGNDELVRRVTREDE